VTGAEREHIIGAASSVPPGAHIVVAVDGREFGVFNVNGAFSALPNACLHQGGPLCRGKLGATLVADAESDWQPRWEHRGGIIACPWHQLQFNVRTGQCLAYPSRRLPLYEVREEDGLLKLLI